MSELGATTSTALVGFDTEWAGFEQVGWAYWAWKYYDDPTGSFAEGLVSPEGNYTPDRDGPVADVPPGGGGHTQLHPVQSVHGCLQHGVCADPRRTGRTTRIVIPASEHYPNGWCVAVKGSHITSSAGGNPSDHSDTGHPEQVYISVTAGGCPSG